MSLTWREEVWPPFELTWHEEVSLNFEDIVALKLCVKEVAEKNQCLIFHGPKFFMQKPAK